MSKKNSDDVPLLHTNSEQIIMKYLFNENSFVIDRELATAIGLNEIVEKLELKSVINTLNIL